MFISCRTAQLWMPILASFLCIPPTFTQAQSLCDDRPFFALVEEYPVGSEPFCLAVADLNGDSIVDIVAANESGNDVSVLLGNPDGTYQPAMSLMVGMFPPTVAVGDLNGDTIPDLAVPNRASDSVSILIGHGDGTFAPKMNFLVGNGPWYIAIADFNSDGDADLAMSLFNENQLGVALGNGDGTFQSVERLAPGSPIALAVADVNHDGSADLVSANVNTNTVSVVLGNGDGSFQEQQTYDVGADPESVAIEDLNGDGHVDLAVANSEDCNASILYGNGDGTFQPQQTMPTGEGPSYVAIGDVDGDQIPDLVVTNRLSHDVSLLLGNGDGSFQEQMRYGVGNGPSCVVLEDLDGDGDKDFVFANQDDNRIRIIRNLGGGLLSTDRRYATELLPRSVIASDLDNDGFKDMVCANQVSDSISVFINAGDGSFLPPTEFDVGEDPATITAADVDGNGNVDLLVPNASSDNLSILLGNGDGTFQDQMLHNVGGEPREVAVGLLNNDSIPDLAVANTSTGNVSVLRGVGNGTFVDQTPLTTNDGFSPVFRRVVIDDLNDDQLPDIAAVHLSEGNGRVLYWFNTGDGVFDPDDRSNMIGAINQGFAIGDIDGANGPDFVVANGECNAIGLTTSLSTERGAFGDESVVYSTGFRPREVDLVDIDGDGDLDAITANRGLSVTDDCQNPPVNGDVSILLNDGTGEFEPEVRLFAGIEPWSIAADDFDNDGIIDLAVADRASNMLSVFISPEVKQAVWTGTTGVDFQDGSNWEDGLAPSAEDPKDGFAPSLAPNVAVFDTLNLTESASLSADTTLLALTQAEEVLNFNTFGNTLDILGDVPQLGLEIGVGLCSGAPPSTQPTFRLLNLNNLGLASLVRSPVARIGSSTMTDLSTILIDGTGQNQNPVRLDITRELIVGNSSPGQLILADDTGRLTYGDNMPGDRFTIGASSHGFVRVTSGTAGVTEVASNFPVDALVLGRDANSSGMIELRGNETEWDHESGTLTVGLRGTGDILIADGASMLTFVNNRITLGEHPGSFGSVVIEGAGSNWTDFFTEMVVGGDGEGALTVRDGGTLSLGAGIRNTTNGVVFADGTVTSVVNFGDIFVSSPTNRESGVGTLTVAGDYRQFDDPQNPEVSGRLFMDVLGGGPNESDKLVITDSANLSGGLIINAPASLDLMDNDTIELLEAADITGRFNLAFLPGVTTDAQGNGRFLKVNYTPTTRGATSMAVTLTVDTLSGQIALDSVDDLSVEGSPVAADVGDLDGDGDLDVALALPDNANEGEAVILLNAGMCLDTWAGFDGSFAFPIDPDPSDIAIGNVDNSAGLDVAVASRATNRIQIYTNDGLGMMGSFMPNQAILVNGEASSVTFGELDKDKWDDLVVGNATNSTIDYFDNTKTAGVFAPPVQLASDADVSGVVTGDVNMDGVVDLVSANGLSGSISVILGNGNGAFQPVVNVDVGGAPGSIVLLDLDDDSDLDIVYTSESADPLTTPNTVEVLRNDLSDGQLIFTPGQQIEAGANPAYLFTADTNGDGQPDLLTLNDISQSLLRGETTTPPDNIGLVRQSACPGDCNGSRAVDFADLVAMLFEFGTPGSTPGCDADASGTVNFGDLVAALFLFGECP